MRAARLQKSLPEGSLPIYPGPRAAHNKLTLHILPQRSLWLAGERVEGQLEIGVLTDELLLGEIGIEFTAQQELRSHDHTSTKRLFILSDLFQSEGYPSNAVRTHAPPVGGGYYPALKGKTRFPFSFELPKDSPSSCSLGGNATTRYELRAFASSRLGRDIDIRGEKKDIAVIERWTDWNKGNWMEGVEKRNSGALKLGGEGRIEVSASVGTEGEGRLFWRRERDSNIEGNGHIEVKVRVKNASKRSVSGLRIALCRRLRVLPARGKPSSPAPLLTTVIVSDHFRGIGFEFPPGQEREVVISTEIPMDECWNARKGPLFELDTLIKVDVDCGFLERDLSVELPIWIAHPQSLPIRAHDARKLKAPHPVSLLPGQQPPFPRSPSAADLFHQAYSDPYQGQQHQHQFAGIPPSSSPAFFAPPVPEPAYNFVQAQYPQFPAAPAPPFAAQQAPYYVVFDPNAADLTASRVLGGADIPSYPSYAPPTSLARPPSATGSNVSTVVPSHYVYTNEPSYGAPHHEVNTPAMVAPPVARSHSLPVPPAPSATPERPTSARDHRPNHYQSLTPEEWETVKRNERPIELYSAMKRGAELVAQEQRELEQRQLQQAPAAIRRSHSSRSTRTPPPPAPSSSFSPVPGQNFALSPHEAALLETIGEDGESQAGTTKSMLALAAHLRDASLTDLQKPLANSPGRNSVSDLEDFVDDPEKMADFITGDKTLPKPPVPSDRTKPSSKASPPRVQDIFATHTLPQSPSSSPTRVASPPRPSQSPVPERAYNGLTKLEALLKRPASPAEIRIPRPPSRARSAVAASPVLSPPLLSPERPHSASALRSKSISRAKSERDLSANLSQEETQAALKRALATPIVAETPRESRTRTKASDPVSLPPVAAIPTRKDDRVVPPARDSPPASERLPQVAHAAAVAPAAPVNTTQPTLGSASDASRVEEHMAVKTQAVSRIGNWLISSAMLADSMPPPSLLARGPETSPASSRTPASSSGRRTSWEIRRPAPAPPASPVQVVAAKSIAPRAKSIGIPSPSMSPEPDVADLIRWSTSPPETSMNPAKPKPPSNLHVDEEAAPRYDVRSARGGKGGKVTSVTNIWSSKISADNTDPPLPQTAPAPKSSTATRNSAKPPVRSVSSENVAPVQARKAAPLSTTKPENTPRAMKRWTAPSAAQPFVNTTMGRSPVLAGLSPNPAPLKPVGNVNANLARLIARYSHDVSQLT